MIRLAVLAAVLLLAVPCFPWLRRMSPKRRQWVMVGSLIVSFSMMIVFPRVGLWLSVGVAGFWLSFALNDSVRRFWREVTR